MTENLITTQRASRLCIAVLLALFANIATLARDVNATAFGAKADGRTVNTATLQRAIDECARTGGGQVVFGPGQYVSGQLRLRSGVTLHLQRGAELQGSVHYTKDYPNRAFIYAEGEEHVGITGEGTINGRGGHPDVKAQGFVVNDSKRPNLVFFRDCRDVRVTDVSLVEAGSWTLRLFRVDGAIIDRINLRSLDQGNNDGIDVDARNVVIANSIIEAEDDGICLKSDDKDFMPENIVVSNCIIASNCNPIKFGTASYAGFRNVNISNCAIRRTTESHIWNWAKEYRGIKEGTLTGLAGIAIESADGGVVEHVNIQNVTMEGIITPIFICLNHRNGDTGRICDIYIQNITARAEGVIPCLITGSNRRRISDIVLRDIRVEHEGGEQPMDERLGESNGYPENRMFGHRNPAGGLYIRHAENVTIDNFKISQRQRDQRPAVVLDDVRRLTATNVTSQGNQSRLVKIQGEASDVSVNGTKYLTEAVGFDWNSLAPGPLSLPGT